MIEKWSHGKYILEKNPINGVSTTANFKKPARKPRTSQLQMMLSDSYDARWRGNRYSVSNGYGYRSAFYAPGEYDADYRRVMSGRYGYGGYGSYGSGYHNNMENFRGNMYGYARPYGGYYNQNRGMGYGYGNMHVGGYNGRMSRYGYGGDQMYGGYGGYGSHGGYYGSRYNNNYR